MSVPVSIRPIPIRVDIFERAFKTYKKKPGSSFVSLAREMKVSVTHLREWRRRGEVPSDKLPVLAKALGVEAERLARLVEGATPSATLALSPARVGQNLLTIARTFRSYTRFLGAHRQHPGYAHHRVFHHPGDSAFYATFFLEASHPDQEWLFSVWFGLRMDYGTVRLNRRGDVMLEPILQDQELNASTGFAAENDEGTVIVAVRTWFGRPSCDFVVHSEKPFEVRVVKDAIDVPGVVTFVKNPFQRDE
jgi:hypothetical protein